MIEIFVLCTIILFICLALLCVKMIVKKNGKFPHTCMGENCELQKRGIKCAQVQDYEAGKQMNLFDRISKYE